MKSRFGFTLIELLIVVAIIAILAAIAVPNFLEAQTRAKVSRAKADLRSLATALEAYAVDNNTYPFAESISASIWLPPGGGPRQNTTARPAGLTSPISYLTSIPVDAFAHSNVDVSGLPTGQPAPLYYEKAGFGFVDGTKLTNMPSQVPTDIVGTNRIDGASTSNTPVTDSRLTPRRWVLYSLGPDLSPHAINTTDKSIISRSRYFIGNRYDPTNGTISTGNVLRFDDGRNYP